MTGDLLHDGRIGIGKDIDAEDLELQREFLCNMLRKAAAEQIDPVSAANLPHDGQDGVDVQMIDGVGHLHQRLVEDFIDLDIVPLGFRLTGQQIAQLREAGYAAFLIVRDTVAGEEYVASATSLMDMDEILSVFMLMKLMTFFSVSVRCS